MRRFCLVLCAALALSAARGVEAAVSCYGFDDGTNYQISPTDPGGWASHTSIDNAITTGIGLGRTVMQFDSGWTAYSAGTPIDETVKLYSVTYEGQTPATTLTFASGVRGFGLTAGTSNVSFTATIQDLGITTTDAHGIYWSSATTSGANANGTLTLDNVNVDAGLAGVILTTALGGSQLSATSLTVRNSTVVANGGNGVAIGGNAVSTLDVLDTRIESVASGIRATTYDSGNTHTGGPYAISIQRAEVVGIGGSTQYGIYDRFNSNTNDLTIVDSLITGFSTGVYYAPQQNSGYSGKPPQSFTMLNCTVAGNATYGVHAAMIPAEGNFNYTTPDVYLINGIFAGNGTAVFLDDQNTTGSDFDLRGTTNAFFANGTDVLMTGTHTSPAAGFTSTMILPGYTLAQAFADPTNGDYRLLATALALIDTGKQYQTTVLASGTQTWVDYNNSGAYDAGVDYIIDLGGYAGSTAGHNLLLLDADISNPAIRLYNGTVDVGAYEYVPEPATLALLALGASSMLRRRRK